MWAGPTPGSNEGSAGKGGGEEESLLLGESARARVRACELAQNKVQDGGKEHSRSYRNRSVHRSYRVAPRTPWAPVMDIVS